jgi:hypothetical protein
MTDVTATALPQFKSQPITVDFFMSQLRLAVVAILAYGGGAHWFTPEAAGLYLTLFTTLGPIAIPWAWSIAANFGKVFVDRNSAAAVVAKVEAVDPKSAVIGATNALIANSNDPTTPPVKPS